MSVVGVLLKTTRPWNWATTRCRWVGGLLECMRASSSPVQRILGSCRKEESIYLLNKASALLHRPLYAGPLGLGDRRSKCAKYIANTTCMFAMPSTAATPVQTQPPVWVSCPCGPSTLTREGEGGAVRWLEGERYGYFTPLTITNSFTSQWFAWPMRVWKLGKWIRIVCLPRRFINCLPIVCCKMVCRRRKLCRPNHIYECTQSLALIHSDFRLPAAPFRFCWPIMRCCYGLETRLKFKTMFTS